MPVLALTATANLQTRKIIQESLCLRKSCIKIFLSPNRENIYINKLKVNSDISESFRWLLDKMRQEKVYMDKTIVYCKSIKDCGRLFTHFKLHLGKDSYYPNCETSGNNLMFAMYHHSTLAKNQARTLESFLDENGKCRLIFATNALGMGVNFPNVRHIIHYGPPREMEELVQQIGRAGRDGRPAFALIMYNGQKTRNCDQLVKDFCKTDNCLRKPLLADFGVKEFANYQTHKCCISCHKECSCLNGSGCEVPLPEISVVEPKENVKYKTRDITSEQRQLLQELLQDYKLELSSQLFSFMGVNGMELFSDILVKKVLKHAPFIFDKGYILDHLPVFNKGHAMDILCMINDVFEDIDEGEIDIDQCSMHQLACPNFEVEHMDLCEEFLQESSGDDDDDDDDDMVVDDDL